VAIELGGIDEELFHLETESNFNEVNSYAVSSSNTNLSRKSQNSCSENPTISNASVQNEVLEV
jgi:hypothetical protein